MARTDPVTEVVISLNCEDIQRFDGGEYGISGEDQAVIDQANGTIPIERPEPRWGFDQFGLDSMKAPYALFRAGDGGE